MYSVERECVHVIGLLIACAVVSEQDEWWTIELMCAATHSTGGKLLIQHLQRTACKEGARGIRLATSEYGLDQGFDSAHGLLCIWFVPEKPLLHNFYKHMGFVMHEDPELNTDMEWDCRLLYTDKATGRRKVNHGG